MNALIDTAADAYVMLDQRVSKAFRDRTEAPSEAVKTPVAGKGYNRLNNQPIDRIT